MSFRFRLFLTLLLVLFIAVYFTGRTLASAFSVSYNVKVAFKNNRSAHFTQEISLKNLTADLYPTEYSLNIGSSNVRSVSGSDSLGPITVTSKKYKGSTVLTARLTDKVVGTGKVTSFTLRYTITNLAQKQGRMWNILVPGINTSEKLSSFKLRISVPRAYGGIYSVYPHPKSAKKQGSLNTYFFDKKSTPAETIVAEFGNYQVVKFFFRYKLKNSEIFGKDEKVLIPRDADFQEIYLGEISPQPVKIETDEDGNYFADYHLKGGEEENVVVRGFAKIHKNFSPKIANLDVNKYLGSSSSWNVNSDLIIKKASELSNIHEIYKFVVENLTFNQKSTDNLLNKREGAQAALNSSGKALTSDFVDLFISLLRAKGIAAKQAVGFAFGDGTNLTPTLVNEAAGSKILHSWVEYFDTSQGKWLQVDPTWGSTRQVNYIDQFDANHFTLFERAFSSGDPKIPDILTNEGSLGDFEVHPVDSKFGFSANPSVEIALSKVIGGFPTTCKVIINNSSGKSLLSAKIVLNTNSLKVIGDGQKDLGTILPYSQYEVDFKVRSNYVVDKGTGSVEATLYGYDQGKVKTFTQSKNVEIASFFSFNRPQIVLVGLLILTLAGFSFPFYRRFRKAK